jgi:uncharacterized protein (TIGR01777 family)
MKAPDRVVIAGATGFIGRALVRELAGSGYQIVALTRHAAASRTRVPDGALPVEWDGRTAAGWGRHVDGALAVVNLTGDSLAKGRWTRAKKERILASRILPGEALVEAVEEASARPRVFVQGSAVGFYGDPGETEIDEDSPAGTGFLAGVVRAWEDSTRKVEALGVRRVVIRSGLVLGRDGGVWPSLVRPFRFFVGGPIGTGRQWFSWISLDDEVRAIRFLIEREGLAGAFDLTAPQPVRQRELCRTVGRVLRRPCWAPVPAVLLKVLFGAKAGETLLVSQRVLPRRLAAAGFAFRHPSAAEAVAALVR